MADAKVTLGQAIDQIIAALDGLDQNVRITAVSAACKHLNVQLSSGNIDIGSGRQERDRTEQTGPDKAGQHDLKHLERHADIRSLKAEKNPDSAKQMACLVAYYLQELAPRDERKQTISTQDIEKYFKQANFKLPKLIESVLKDAKRSGYFESVARGEYKLNAVGYNLAVHGLPAKKAS